MNEMESIYTRRELSNMMMTTLPREVRDMIYMHLCKVPGPIIMPSYMKPSQWIRVVKEIVPDRRCFDPNYVSHDFFLELAEVFYRCNRFHLDLHDVTELLRRDFCGLGIQPQQYLRALTVAVDVYDDDEAPFDLQCATIYGALESLMGVRLKTGFRLRLNISPEALYSGSVREALTFIRPRYLKLKDAGFVMSAILDEPERYGLPYDIGNLFEGEEADFVQALKNSEHSVR
ncbi:hypothetical protein BCR34DRAFT_580182 [Clohesyomyces aquaticus]|uniref:Uncharacterized protein n=1 Tax=Clohesyomyces aquaticus TaxID=1231657 RepID=A0A1Y1Y7X5_9PLEO|nr:hypothetical protein BCR34DRAFT_580182 [Clohesyomyces aquaticus]